MIGIGSNDDITLKLGTSTVSKAYWGTTQVYPNAELPYESQYLTIEALSSGTFSLNDSANTFSYSTNGGSTWSNMDSSTSVSLTNGDKMLLKCSNPILTKSPNRWNNYGIGIFGSTCNFKVYGNAMSLLYGDNFQNQTALPTLNNDKSVATAGYQFNSLFNGCTHVYDAQNLILPATMVGLHSYDTVFYGCTNLTTPPALPSTTLAEYCYSGMFQGCTSLTSAPELPATTSANYCYSQMFSGCTSLVTAPVLPATTMTNWCYNSMFYGCTSLTSAPALPATTLATLCYQSMFRGCTSLTTAPSVLPATRLANSCYEQMFLGCTSLTTAPVLPATTLAYNCYSDMFYGCTRLRTAPSVLPATTLADYCYHQMFRECTALVTAPVLPATTLANYCYQQMFQDCSSLTTAPELPATTLVTGCYVNMFRDCSSLNYIKAMFTTTPATSTTNVWVKGVASRGTFVKNVNATWTTTGNNGVPSGWTVQTASE